MKLKVFQSDKGDCLLIEGRDGKTVLVDGGMASTYTAHVAPSLDKMRQAGKKLDVVYVSHIDEDHISGVLEMMDDAVAWRIFDYQTTDGGNPNFKAPKVLRPPEIDRVWHNAFHEQVEDNDGEIEDMLAATATILAATATRKYDGLAQFQMDVATSVRQAINLSRRLGDKQLDIKLNPDAGGKMMMLKRLPSGKYTPPVKVGKMIWTIIGPTNADLEALKKEWNEWLKENKETVARIEDSARRTEKNIGNSVANEVNQIANIAAKQADLLASKVFDTIALNNKSKLGARQKVTVPNLASLMFLLEEKAANGKIKTVLLTGDGHHLDILKGLELQKKIEPDESIYIDVMKVPHHGSEYNLDEEFCKRIIADHYIFCGNGAHENPDLRVVSALIESRVNPDARGTHPKTDQPFKLWFNSFSANPEAKEKDNEHMKKVEDLVKKYQTENPGKIEAFFLQDSFFELDI